MGRSVAVVVAKCDLSHAFGCHAQFPKWRLRGMKSLLSGRTTPDQLPALVAAEYRSAKWIILGNRRLKVLQELEPRWPSLKTRVNVHDMSRSFFNFVLEKIPFSNKSSK